MVYGEQFVVFHRGITQMLVLFVNSLGSHSMVSSIEFVETVSRDKLDVP